MTQPNESGSVNTILEVRASMDVRFALLAVILVEAFEVFQDISSLNLADS